LSVKKVLFINHDASRSGAPIILLNFLKWFKANSKIPFRVLSKKSGDLDQDFQDLTKLDFFKRTGLSGNELLNRVLSATGLHKVLNRLHFKRLLNELIKDNIGLIYSNTITNGEILKFLSGMNCPIITHVHELEYWIHRSGPSNLEKVKNYTNLFIVVSEAVKKHLVINHDIPADHIVVIRGFIPVSALTDRLDTANNPRKNLNIPDDAFIVGSSGMETWRKGKDLFIQLAIAVLRKVGDMPIHFVWIGGHPDSTEAYQIRHDLHHAGIENQVHFVDHVKNPLDYYNQFDAFAMVSREDPFPLVNLEAAALGKPIVCFDSAGGSPEFVEEDAGFVVPYLDISAMADKVVLLAMNIKIREDLGSRGSEKVAESYDISVGALKILDVIEQHLG
jgi:glycosyltransferase involved in cell wall biosynthesis